MYLHYFHMKRLSNLFNAIVAFIQKHPKWALGIFVAFIAIGQMDSSNHTSTPSEETKIVQVDQNTVDIELPEEKPLEVETNPKETEKPAVEVVFDVPSLFGLNIDEVRNKLVDDAKKAELQADEAKYSQFETEEDLYESDGFALIVNFRKEDRMVTSFFISKVDEAFSEAEMSHVLQSFGLAGNVTEYTTKPQEALAFPGEFAGIRVETKAQKQATKNRKNTATVAEVEPILVELQTTGLIMKINPEGG